MNSMPTISAGHRPQIHASDSAATESGVSNAYLAENQIICGVLDTNSEKLGNNTFNIVSRYNF
jgi:hypothetical protein